MNITFYGVRGVYPREDQMNCALVEVSGGRFFVDLGSPRIFDDASLIHEVDHVLITHLHPDHIAMLGSYIIGRISMHAAGETGSSRCTFVAPESIRDYMVFSELGAIESYDQTSEVPEMWMGASLSAVVTNHPKLTYAYRIEDGGRSAVFSGDTSYSKALAEFCAGADLVVLESSFREEHRELAEEWGHMCPSLTAQLVREARPRKLVLNHFVEMSGEEYRQEVLSRLDEPIPIEIAREGRTFQV
ncbi:MBL fold metallo-hydrolase [Kiritimatiella glycovorans]|uniref:Beta-lactamase domain protein n=1 Tax=Kiritimatiella glycovorans TaxID=1307763 RepID=A0A0G3EEX0_9BACT|nr:MBL fold metallo-hydrolase [Kiritimatiella glycovorans]AKJ64858.1 Beta-lactamase domain protein [Kiritimatiella glycovorans]